MDTIKTAAVVVLLLAVLYGVYVVLNRPGSGLPAALIGGGTGEDVEPLVIDIPELPTPLSEFSAGGLQEFTPPGAVGSSPAPPDAFGPPSTEPPREPPIDYDTGPRVDYGSASPPDASAAGYAPRGTESPSPAPQNFGALNFHRDWETARRQIEEQRFREALLLLSKYYQSPDLTATEQQSLVDLLDALAGKVIYSTEPLLGESLYETRGENLFEIARNHNVPWELLRNINGLRDPETVLPGQRLKAPRGPFRAEVSLTRRQLTLFLGDMYAGRFDVGFGDEPASAGAYSVQRKDPAGRDYFSPRMNLAKGEAHNPYGRHYLDLGNGAAIHGSPTAGTGENLGCISLSPRDAEDVFGILSEGSSVTIRR